MPWYNPFSWGRRNLKRDAQFSRTAIDSSDDEIMEPTSIRWPYELKLLGMRRARVMGLSFGEYVRHLVARDVDSGTIPGQKCACVTRNDRDR